jgi:hypothetical protein
MVRPGWLRICVDLSEYEQEGKCYVKKPEKWEGIWSFGSSARPLRRASTTKFMM